jgi:predicted RNase H-like HicB family nuclease
MGIPVLIVPVEPDRFQARTSEPFAWSAEGATPEEAMENLRAVAGQSLQTGARIEDLDLPPKEDPWLRFAGDLKDDPLVEEWRQAVADYRRAIDEDPEVP